MRNTKVYSITMPPEMAKQAERLAKKENRTMSELMREALRRYQQPAIFDLREYIRQIAPTPPAMQAMQEDAKRKGTDKLTMAQIDREVAAVRRQHAGKKKTKATQAMIRVVIDTNVVISANLVDEGPSAAVLSLAVNKKILMFVSTAVLAEYEEVLRRPRLKFDPDLINAFLATIRSNATLVQPIRTISEIKKDDPDNRFLECADAAGAEYIITGNTKHFPERFENIRIVTPQQFLEILSSQLTEEASN